jgi:hypothetical protein
MYPATRTTATVCGMVIRKIRHYGEPHLLALTVKSYITPEGIESLERDSLPVAGRAFYFLQSANCYDNLK